MTTNALAAGIVGCVFGVAAMVQSCGGGDGATQPQPTAPTGAFTLTAAPANVLQGGSGESRIDIVRTGGFGGTVALAVTGAPAGVTATIDPASTTGATANLVVTTTASVAAGNITLTIVGTANGQTDQTVTAPIAIMSNDGAGGNVTLDFSQCPLVERPIWFAVQDGAGSWRQILGVGDVYRFNVASTKGGYAIVSQGSQSQVYVSLASRSELTSLPSARCAGRGSKTASGTLAGITADDVPYVGLGGGTTDPEGGPAPRNFELTGVHDGPQDLIAYSRNPTASPVNDRAIIRRDQNMPNHGSLGIVDFAGPDAFAPASATLTIDAVASLFMAYLTGPGCSYSSLYDQPAGGTTATMRGIPPAQQRATDFHFATVYVIGPDYREATEAFHTLANRIIKLPPPLPAPTITALPGGHKRLQVSLTLPSEYQSALLLNYFEQGRATAWVNATFAWLGGSAVTLAFPDLSGVTGFKSSFLPPSNASVRWFIAASGASDPANLNACVENARFVTAYLSGQ